MTAPAIIATTASSQFSGTFAGTNATDRNFVSYWVASTSTGWLRVQLASPYAATGYRLMSNFEPNRAPRSWTFEGSNDGTTWDVLDTRTDVPNWASPGELRAYTFSNSTAYEYYRVNVTANKGDAYLALAEFWMDAPPQDSGSDPFPAEVVADSPTIWIRGSETSGALADDSSGNAIPALLAGTYARNAASLLTAGSDPAIGFTAARGSIPSAPVVSTAAITLEAVIHSTSVGAYQIIWLRDDENGGNRCWQFRVTPTGALEFIWWNNSSGGPYTVVSSAGVIVEDTTHHVAATYDGSNARLYVDGAQVAVTAQAGTLRATNITTRAIRIAGTSTSGFPLIGRGDEFLLYDGVALSAARIAAHAAAVTALAGPTATLTATTGGSATIEVGPFAASASLTATTGGSAALGVIHPGFNAEATLTVTTGGTAALEVGPFSAFASLTATTGGAATIGGATAVVLAATTDGTATLGAGTSVYAAVALTVTTGGSAALGVTATATATLAATTSGSAWLARTWTPDPVTGRGAFALTVTDRAGAPLASLDTSYFTRAIVDRLNDVDGTGSGAAFTVPDEATDTHAKLRQYRELQVSRGGHHLGTYVLLNPDDTGTASSVSWQAAGLGHYFTKRRIGPAVRPGLLPKQWRAGFREGSIPPAPPKWSRPGTPALVGPALRVEGSTYVQRTVTRLGADTTFAFGSYVLTGTGKDALRAFAQEIVVDTDLTDLIDIEPPTVTIEGHTDNVPYTSHPGGNQWLSEQRANAVRDFLAPLVPEGTTLNAVGYGATRPVASNATSAGRQANRRVDLTYPKTVSARGHRQYLQDRLIYTNPSAHIKRNLTFVSWWSLESYKEPNADGSVIWLGRRPVGSTDDDAWTEADWVDIDDETPLNTWTRSEVSITVPADGQAWEIVARLTPPAGTIVYDEGATELYADDALEFIDVDQALIVKGLVEHAQDPAFDKDDLGIATDTPLTGIKRTRVYYWHERATISDCLEELVNISGGMDLTWQTSPTTRTLVSHYPRAGQVTSASLQAGAERTVDDYQISLNGAAAATTVIVQADGSGADREEGVMQGVPADLDLVLEDVWTAEPGTHVGELNNQAARGHRNYGGHVSIVTATLRQEHTDEWLDRVHLGDVITVDLPARVRHVTGPHRVTARSLDPITDRVIVSPTVEV